MNVRLQLTSKYERVVIMTQLFDSSWDEFSMTLQGQEQVVVKVEELPGSLSCAANHCKLHINIYDL